jgi:hypothetical protein
MLLYNPQSRINACNGIVISSIHPFEEVETLPVSRSVKLGVWEVVALSSRPERDRRALQLISILERQVPTDKYYG